MKTLDRDLQKIIEKWLFKNKVITIYGPRQVGKTTLAKKLLNKYGNEQNYFNCDHINVRDSLQHLEPLSLKKIIGNAKIVVFDEAQKIENIGLILKILHDTYPELQIIATGSSSFDLANRIQEPLTGRGLEYILYPFSLHELTQIYRRIDLNNQLEQLLLFGSYPEIVQASSQTDARNLLDNLTNKYLYKDVLEFETIKHPNFIVKLLQLLAFQVGNEVSIHELANNLNISRKTVERYLDILEKAFVIFRLKAFSRNLRKEITKKEKIYFYDLGIRNSLIAQYNPLNLRQDKGALWENFCIVERLKYLEYTEHHGNKYFWRTHDQKEIDYVEDYDGILHGYEFKWDGKSYKIPKDFLTGYPGSSVTIIDRNNYLDFLCE
jgi:hypothetical protein